MTAKELQKRGAKAELLRVLQTEDGSFYAESAEGKILYRVIADDQETSCTCADFSRQSKNDPNFQCKHILSVLNCVPTGDVQSAQYLERKKPKLDERWIIDNRGQPICEICRAAGSWPSKGHHLRLRWNRFSYPPRKTVTPPYARQPLFLNQANHLRISEMPTREIAAQKS